MSDSPFAMVWDGGASSTSKGDAVGLCDTEGYCGERYFNPETATKAKAMMAAPSV